MKYLDEQIEGTYSSLQSYAKGVYRYEVVRLNAGQSTLSSNNYTTIFVGTFYHTFTNSLEASTFKVDITDIIRNDVWSPTVNELYNSSTVVGHNCNLVNQYYVFFYTNSSTHVNSAAIQVAKVYRYPHYISDMSNECFFDFTQNGYVSFPLQGRYSQSGYRKYHLTPKYPFISTNNYNIILVSENSLNVTTSTAHFTGGLTGSFSVPFAPPSSYISYKLSNLLNNSSTEVAYYATLSNATDSEWYDVTLNNNIATIDDLDGQQPIMEIVSTALGTNISKSYSGALYPNGEFEFNLKVDTIFLQANNSNSIYAIIYDNGERPTNVSNTCYVKIKFSGLPSASYLTGRTVKIRGTYEEIAQGSRELKNIRLVDTLDANQPTYLEIGGDGKTEWVVSNHNHLMNTIHILSSSILKQLQITKERKEFQI